MKTSLRDSIKNIVKILGTGLMIMACLIVVSCNSENTHDHSNENTYDRSNENTPDQTRAPKISFHFENYSIPGVLTIDKPEGWSFYKAGDYNTIAFLTRDETEPLRQVFLFGEVGIFYTNQEQKDLEIYYQNNGGHKVQWIDMPIVSPFDGQTFFENFYSIMNTQIGNTFRSAGQMPVPAGFDQITVVSQKQVESTVPGLRAYLVRAVLSGNGTAAQGIFIASPFEDGYGHGTAYVVAGITAPIREFDSVQAKLTEVLNSFTLDSSYVERGINVINENGESFTVMPGQKHVHPWCAGNEPLVYTQKDEFGKQSHDAVQEVLGVFATVAELAREGKVNKDGLPKNPLQLAATLRTLAKHGGYDASIPIGATNFISATLGKLAELLGYRGVNSRYLQK